MRLIWHYKRGLRKPRPHISSMPYFPPWINMGGTIIEGLPGMIRSGITIHARPANFRIGDGPRRYSVTIDNMPARGRRVSGDVDKQLDGYRRQTSA